MCAVHCLTGVLPANWIVAFSVVIMRYCTASADDYGSVYTGTHPHWKCGTSHVMWETRRLLKGRVVFSTNVRIGLGRRKIIFKPLWHETKHEIWLINNKWISTCDNTQWNLNTEIKNIINSLSYNSSCCTSHMKNNNIKWFVLFAVSSSMFWLQSLMHCKMQELPLKPPMLYQVMVCWKHNSFCCAVFNLCAQNTSFKHGDKFAADTYYHYLTNLVPSSLYNWDTTMHI